MSSSLQLSFRPVAASSSAFESSSNRKRARRLHILCSSTQSTLPHGEEEEDDNEPKFCSSSSTYMNVILVERYANGTSRRYVLDDSQIRSFVEEEGAENRELQDEESHFSDLNLSWLPFLVKDFILPAGFPGSVSGSTAAASAAAIRWVSKDGIGALGRLFIGGRFGSLFDDDPKQWRMYADFIGSAGSIFDLITQVYPAYFLPLASLGNLTKAVARGLKDPSFRVIQNHFAISGNLGEVAAKEEVWEVGAQLLGLALGILILDTPGLVKSFPALALTWMSMRLLHLWLRYLSLSVLEFDTINLKRARLLVKSHILNSAVLGCVDCNRQENILSWETFMKPRIIFSAPLEEMVGGERNVSQVKTLLKLYAKEKYFLVVNQQKKDLEVFISFKVGATSMSVLRSVWQTCWLNENWESSANVWDQLAQSLLEMEVRFEDFIKQLEVAGWNTHQINLKVPREIFIDERVTF